MIGSSGPDDGRTTLITRLDAATGGRDHDSVVAAVKAVLEELAPSTCAGLPERYRQAAGDRYARRLLHRDDDRGYSVVVMAWGPGQATCLHDHAGMWCVECVVAGELDVTRYDLVERQADRYRFERQAPVRAEVGDAGSLIPPYEYHVISNARPSETSVTLHVYGGEMDHCNLYEPSPDGWWTRVRRSLSYD